MADSLIPRRKLFGNPTYVDPAISPDGQWLSWGAPVDGVMNIWLAPRDDLKSAEALTRTKGMPIWGHMWSGDGAYIGYGNDENGDENNHIFVVDPRTKELRDLTPIKGVAAQFIASSWLTPRHAAIGLNDRDARWHDVYTLNLDSGERQLIYENTHNFEFVMTDAKLHPRLARSTVADGASVYWKIDEGRPIEMIRLSYEDSLLTRPISFSLDGKKLLMGTTVGRNTQALVERDWQSGAEHHVVSHPKFDLNSLWFNPKTFELQLAGVNGAGEEWIHVSDDVQDDWAKVRGELRGFATSIISSSLDDRHWVIVAHKPQQGGTYFHFDRGKSVMNELFRARPEMKQYKLAPMQLIETKSRDGLDLYSLLTLPENEKGHQPKEPLPLVLNVHGGPWGQDYFGYNREHQWLANRGYAVLAVNYRASTGFGKKFVAAGEKEHAGKMHDDLIDMVNWAIAEGIADPKKIAIMGASYGGYASFIGATFTPEVFCCSVPIVGITNLQTLLENMPPYWAGFAEFMYRSYGDPRTQEGRSLLAERSPIHKVGNIKKPMLIFHGLNDVRCKITESDSIVAAMQEKNIPVTYVVYPDEGHGFSRHENQLSSYAITEAFLAKHLGGSCEPMGCDLEGSSHEIRAGSLSA